MQMGGRSVGGLSQYLDLVPVELMLAGVFILAFGLLSLPARHRMQWTLSVAVVWLVIGRLPDIPVAAAVAKASSVVPLLLIIVAVLRDGRPRLRVPTAGGVYVLVAVLAVPFVATTVNAPVAMAQRFQW